MKIWMIVAIVIIAASVIFAFSVEKGVVPIEDLPFFSQKSSDINPSDEITRLSRLADDRMITEKDFANIQAAIGGDSRAQGQIDKVKQLVQQQQFQQAEEELDNLNQYVQKIDILCPGQDLVRYYQAMENSQYEIANGALGEAKEHINDWIPQATQYLAQNPNGENIDDIVAAIRGHIDDITNGIKNITQQDLQYLIDKASICVEVSS